MPTNTVIKAFSVPGWHSWTCPAGVTSVYVRGCGAGGNGATGAPGTSAIYTASPGGGGGGGAFAVERFVDVIPGREYAIFVGIPLGNPGDDGNPSFIYDPTDNKYIYVASGGGGAPPAGGPNDASLPGSPDPTYGDDIYAYGAHVVGGGGHGGSNAMSNYGLVGGGDVNPLHVGSIGTNSPGGRGSAIGSNGLNSGQYRGGGSGGSGGPGPFADLGNTPGVGGSGGNGNNAGAGAAGSAGTSATGVGAGGGGGGGGGAGTSGSAGAGAGGMGGPGYVELFYFD